MIKLPAHADSVCVAKVYEAGQEQVFDHWDSLTVEQQHALLEQLRDIDFQLLKRLIQQHLHSDADTQETRVLKPAEMVRPPRYESEREDYELCRTLGEYALRNAEVAIVTAAGSSRLGARTAAEAGSPSDPVGLLPIGPVTGKCLLQLHAEKIRALNRRYKTSLRWAIFCHPENLGKLSEVLRQSGFYGLNSSAVQLIPQTLLPVVDRRGKLLMSSAGTVAMTPPGHGGILSQVLKAERLSDYQRNNVKYLFYFQENNPLVQIADPLFLGFHIKNQNDLTAKAVRKSSPNEPVGVFCRFNGSISVVEYTELSEEDRDSRNPQGELTFSAGNIGIHVISTDFLDRLAGDGTQLPFHAVEVRTPYVNRKGRLVRPTEPNSFKFQNFVFDAMLDAKRATVLEVAREQEFSPIRNTSGNDSPLTAQRDLSRLYRAWLQAAWAEFDGTSVGTNCTNVEISPLTALDAGELKEQVKQPPKPTADILL